MDKPQYPYLVKTLDRNSEQKQSILLIDDCPDLLSLNKAILEIDNFEVYTALSGKEAFAILGQIKQPNLIILDIRMADLSGFEFLRELESRMPNLIESVPVVFLTGMEKVPESRAVGVIRKPVDLDRFLAAVHRFIEMGANPHRCN